jgi:hypothetical protein
MKDHEVFRGEYLGPHNSLVKLEPVAYLIVPTAEIGRTQECSIPVVAINSFGLSSSTTAPKLTKKISRPP